MKNITHYYFAVAIILVDIWLLDPLSSLEKLLLFPVMIGAGSLTLLPNKLEKWLCIDRKTRTCTERCRHPLTHHPVLVFVLIWIFGLIPITPPYFRVYHLLAKMILLAIGSHLVLDMLTPEGLPLGLTPTVFCQDDTKNYSFNDITKPRMRLRLFQGIFSRDSSNANRNIILTSKLILLVYCFVLVLEITYNPEILTTLYQIVFAHLNGWIMLVKGELKPWF